jgi:anti-sigma B factor antagonist
MTEAATEGPNDLLRVSSATRGTTVIVTAAGELDLMTAPTLQQALTAAWAAAPERLVLDLSKVTFLASVGMAVLAEHHQSGQAKNVPFFVVTADHTILRTLQLTGLADFLTILPDLQAALART